MYENLIETPTVYLMLPDGLSAKFPAGHETTSHCTTSFKLSAESLPVLQHPPSGDFGCLGPPIYLQDLEVRVVRKVSTASKLSERTRYSTSSFKEQAKVRLGIMYMLWE